ncbi:hypothetical protein ABZ470_00950 [Streptosporangium sp. NPDC020072]|uniref:hypothetical protein n=1 Tax=Streptosporangium sp. NPDC020072 TaxID=3154788 RepID=UPI003418084D
MMRPGNRPARALSVTALGVALAALAPLPALAAGPAASAPVSTVAPATGPGSGMGEPVDPGEVEPGISWTNTLKPSGLGRRGTH